MPHKDPEKRRVYGIKYRKENKERIKANNKKYYEENKEEILVKQRKYNEENREGIRAYHKELYEENREERKAKQRKYCEENREKENDRSKKTSLKLKTEEPSVIYVIECKATNKYYIGQTGTWFERRMHQHKSLFKNNCNSCGLGMQDDYNIHGPDSFEYRVLKELDPLATKEERLKEERETLIKFIREGKKVYNQLN